MLNMKLSLNKMHLYADMHDLSYANLSTHPPNDIFSLYNVTHYEWRFLKGHGVKLQSGPAVSEVFILSGNP